MRKTVLHLYCPKRFVYDINRCRVYLPPGKNITRAIVLSWNEWWYRNDHPQNEYDVDLHEAQYFHWDEDTKELVMEAGESFGMEDFVATLEFALKIRFIPHDGEPYP